MTKLQIDGQQAPIDAPRPIGIEQRLLYGPIQSLQRHKRASRWIQVFIMLEQEIAELG